MRLLWITIAVVITAGILALQRVAWSPEIEPPPVPCDSDAVSARDYSVYRTLLEEYSTLEGPMCGATILIADTTRLSNEHLSFDEVPLDDILARAVERKEGVTLSNDAVTNFIRLFKESNRLDTEEFSDLQQRVLDQSEIDTIYARNGGWLHSGAPTVVRFSRVGFSCDGNQALLYRADYCGGLCGSGVLYLLQKNGNTWERVLGTMLWIS